MYALYRWMQSRFNFRRRFQFDLLQTLPFRASEVGRVLEEDGVF